MNSLTKSERIAEDRHLRATLTTYAGLIQRGSTVVVGLVTVPLTIQYLGPSRFGIWMVLSSYVGFLQYADLGIGVGLQNQLAESIANDEKQKAKQTVSSAICLGMFIFALVSAIAVFLLPLVPSESIVLVDDPSVESEVIPAAQLILIASGYGVLSGFYQRIFNALQRGYIQSLLVSIGNLVGLLCIWLSIQFDLGLNGIVVSFLLGRLVLLQIGILYYVLVRDLRPSPRYVSLAKIVDLAKTAWPAFLTQVSALLILACPAIVIGQRCGSEAVVEFSIVQKILSILGAYYVANVLALWPAYTDAKARHDIDWVKKTYRASQKRCLKVQIIASIAMLLLGPFVIKYWTKGEIPSTDITLIAVTCLWFSFHLFSMSSGMLLNGFSELKKQAIYGPIIGIAAIAIAFLVPREWGAIGIVSVFILAGSLVRSIVMWLDARFVLERFSSRTD